MVQATHKISELFLGAPLDPFSKETKRHIALIAFLAWIGLGADGLSSSCYGPEEAFLALGDHRALGLYMAAATAITVFIIAIAYNQVIELFPSGGGGYKVATSLIGPYTGLVSGAALIVDYMLTIAISVASGVDAVFSLLPPEVLAFKPEIEVALVGLLIFLNLRGMRESIKMLLPIFLGFFITHALLILFGVGFQADRLPALVPGTLAETSQLAGQLGWVFVASLFLRAYSLGGGTYTGIEAVSNNVQSLAEPRVRTGKWTMFYMATSLSFTAGGIILLYLLWDVRPVEGQTLNAVAFRAILEQGLHNPAVETVALWTVLALEGGLLLVAANTGFLGGPAVLANMAADSWVPHQYRYLSSRLVTQRGIQLMGVAAIGILLVTAGSVALLVVLYSINVFLTFSLSLLGLCIYWWRVRRSDRRWLPRLCLSAFGLVVTGGILVVTTVEKFAEGGFMTLVITGIVIALCSLNHAPRSAASFAPPTRAWRPSTTRRARRPSRFRASPRLCSSSARAAAAASTRSTGSGANSPVTSGTSSSSTCVPSTPNATAAARSSMPCGTTRTTRSPTSSTSATTVASPPRPISVSASIPSRS